MEKGKDSRIPDWDTTRISYRMIIAVSDGTVTLHFSKYRIVTISDSATTLDLAQIRVITDLSEKSVETDH